MRRRAATKTQSAVTCSLADKIHQEVESFYGQTFNPEQELKDQCKRIGINWKDTSIDWERVNEYDTLHVSQHFDLAEYWKNVGKKRFPLFAIAVPSIMSLPGSNAHQERTFSTCTHFNDTLRARLKDDKFEMSVIIAANKSITSAKIPTEEEAKAIIANTVKQIESSELEFDIEHGPFHEDATNLVRKLF